MVARHKAGETVTGAAVARDRPAPDELTPRRLPNVAQTRRHPDDPGDRVGPIVIGQACEFDYSGTQGCKALREEGYRVVLVNSNPATIMTDPETADRTYVEPMTVETLEKIIARSARTRCCRRWAVRRPST